MMAPVCGCTDTSTSSPFFSLNCSTTSRGSVTAREDPVCTILRVMSVFYQYCSRSTCTGEWAITAIAPTIAIGSVGARPNSRFETRRLTSDRATEADGDSGGDEEHRFADDQPHHVLSLRAKRDADADLVRSGRDAVRHQAEQTHRGNKQREPEHCVRPREHVLLTEAAFDFFDLRGHADERHVRVDLKGRFADARDCGERTARRPHLEGRAVLVGDLEGGRVHRPCHGAADAAAFRLTQHA